MTSRRERIKKIKFRLAQGNVMRRSSGLTDSDADNGKKSKEEEI